MGRENHHVACCEFLDAGLPVANLPAAFEQDPAHRLGIRDVLFDAVDKADLVSLERRFGASLMPEYAELLSDTEVTDLVAYLSSLKGNR